MKFRTIKGYVLVIAGGFVILSAAILFILQWGKVADFSAYGPHVGVNTSLLMIFSAIGGLLLVPLIRAFFKGMKIVWTSQKNLHGRKLKQQENPPPQQTDNTNTQSPKP